MIDLFRRLVDLIWYTPPQGQTLQERYPAAPGVPTFTYANVDLPNEAYVQAPRPLGWRASDYRDRLFLERVSHMYSCPWCGAPNAQIRSVVKGIPVVVIECRQCEKVTKIADVSDIWGPETRLVDTSKPPEE